MMVSVTHDAEEAVVLSDRIEVVRGHPGGLHAAFDVDPPRPRRRTAPEVQALKERVIRALDLS
ncbi:ABC transporter, ATP-binding protein [alpha proteobacterium BAL199]|nr:ABC transporter, ATP-binding protein [alpha proteobacterium BAL199]